MTARPEDAELLRVVDASGAPRGLKRRGAVHRDGDWHRVFHCWVAGVGEDGPFVLLQRRSAGKDVNPGRWDVSCAGHLAAGEGDADGVRELAEELGVAARYGDLVRLGAVTEDAVAPGIVDREVCATYLWRSNAALDTYRPAPDEVDGIAAVSLADAARLAAGASSVPAHELVAASREVRGVTVSAADLVPRPVGRYAWAVSRIAAALAP